MQRIKKKNSMLNNSLLLKIIYISFLCLVSVIAQADILLPAFDMNDMIIHHKYYTLEYNKNTKQADWVAYSITREMILNGKAEITYDFNPDPLIPDNDSASIKDYLNTGFVCGQLCPASVMKVSEEAVNETFYMSNISPQEPYFNYYVWNKLITKLKEWAVKNREIYVITGPVFNKYKKKLEIGNSRIEVPSAFFAVVFDFKISNPKAIGFIFPNKKSHKPLKTYATTVDKIEEVTGIDFFHVLPDFIEYKMESKYNYQSWN